MLAGVSSKGEESEIDGGRRRRKAERGEECAREKECELALK